MKLHGFNNLTKSLSFNMYDICYTKSASEREAYIAYIDEVYNADRLTSILKNVADIIGAHILNVAKQDYVPQGASVTMLISEGPIEVPKEEPPVPQAVVCALDKAILPYIHIPNIIRTMELARFGLILMSPRAGKFHH
ncbi:S-adenosylmethionine decarboxylase proenzyme precursor [Anoxybacillus sp. BCO1]|nr:S-adenosylmethionine decarboxylase proenzyme precursor [Anoxybacillus sp. BCO1]